MYDVFHFEQPVRQKRWKELFRDLSTAQTHTWGEGSFGRLGRKKMHDLDADMESSELTTLATEVIVDIKAGYVLGVF